MLFRPSLIAHSLVMKWLLCALSCPFTASRRAQLDVSVIVNNSVSPGAIIGDGDRKSCDPRGPMIWDNFSIFRTNCAMLTSYIRARVVVSRVDVATLPDQKLRNC